jgi:hypothetical protein
LNDPDLTELIRDVFDTTIGGPWWDNGDGTFYGQGENQDYATGASYTYALHFVRKFYDPARGYVEKEWLPPSEAMPEESVMS